MLYRTVNVYSRVKQLQKKCVNIYFVQYVSIFFPARFGLLVGIVFES
jgi:hypothetical protein